MTLTTQHASAADLKRIASNYTTATQVIDKRIIICAGTGCVANGSLALRDALQRALKKANLSVTLTIKHEKHEPTDVHLSKSGCQGFCQMGPLVHIEPAGISYVKVRPDDADDIIEHTIRNGHIVKRLLYTKANGATCVGPAEIPFYNQQTRVVLANCMIEPSSIAEYIARDGYRGAEHAFAQLTPEAVCAVVSDAGLRGRGGGGFPTGKKWELTLANAADKEYVICNGDEGDPGAFMDRSVMEGNPHAVIEGMMIAARAIEADEGYVYVRAEYPLAVERMSHAVSAAEAEGILGDNCFGSGRGFTLHVMEGAGAFVCGEETALIASIEGKRGMPRPKPPFPAESGLWGKPTLINNVETLASIPTIIRNGADAYKALGTTSSPGTKTFALTGHVGNTGLIEVPFGTTLRTIVDDIGGGVRDNDGHTTNGTFKAVQIGGPSGGCLTPAMLDTPLDFDNLRTLGAMVGSGGLVVMNQQTCMVQIAKFFMEFTQVESCGKCVPCREGTKQMLALLTDICEGRATVETLNLLEKTAQVVQLSSLCGLGKTAPNPVLSTLRHFREEYEVHVVDRLCPAGQCSALAMPEIDPELCTGCTLCARKCPTDCISGERKEPHVIDTDNCIRCGACADACRKNAVSGF